MKTEKIKIYIDTREQNPWLFDDESFEIESIKLDTGDYFIEDIPDLVIERKRSTGEIALNLGKKWKQFESELKRMEDYKYSYIICEFPLEYLDCFPENSGIPKGQLGKVRMNSGFIKSRLFSNCAKYNIKLLFFNSPEEAKNCVIDIIKNKGKY